MIRCYVTDRRQEGLLSHVSRAIAAGVDLIQVREKDLPAIDLVNLVCAVRDLAAGTTTKVLVNDRMDVSMATGIDGVHLPANGLPASVVRPHVKILGVSTHTIEEAVHAGEDRADYIVFGPVFDTPGKKAVGLEALRKIVRSVKIPVLAIGGITPESIPEIMQTGAAGFAAIRMFQS
jgi:thiamine-phosphate diphosphorylase